MENKQKITVIHLDDERYPAAFRAIGNAAPKTLYALGNIELLKSEHMTAIIGARKASPMGNEAAYQLAAKLASEGHVIVSGLALGCDAAAHRGCLAAGGKTIAIVANGLDIIYPKENIPLQEEILRKGGLILSEQPVGTPVNPTRLVTRNRLQAALSQTVIVAECPVKSGTMYTVEYARKYKKRIQAVQFPIENDLNGGNRHIVEKGIGEYIKVGK